MPQISREVKEPKEDREEDREDNKKRAVLPKDPVEHGWMIEECFDESQDPHIFCCTPCPLPANVPFALVIGIWDLVIAPMGL